MPDSYEDLNGLDKNTDDAALDLDMDGSTNLSEYLNKTDPQDEDSDDDTLFNSIETGTGIFVDAADTGTNPNKADTDDEEFSDNLEIIKGTDRNDPASRPTAQLVAWWPLDVDGTDASGNGYDGTVIGTPVPSPFRRARSRPL